MQKSSPKGSHFYKIFYNLGQMGVRLGSLWKSFVWDNLGFLLAPFSWPLPLFEARFDAFGLSLAPLGSLLAPLGPNVEKIPSEAKVGNFFRPPFGFVFLHVVDRFFLSFTLIL